MGRNVSLLDEHLGSSNGKSDGTDEVEVRHRGASEQEKDELLSLAVDGLRVLEGPREVVVRHVHPEVVGDDAETLGVGRDLASTKWDELLSKD